MTITKRLRALFKDRDDMAEKLAAKDAEINSAIRELCREEGIAFMRVETARMIVAEEEREEAA